MSKVSKVSAAATVALGSPLSAVRIEAQAAITSAIAQATPTHVSKAKRATGAAVYDVQPFSAFEVAVFDACVSLERGAWEADNKRATIVAAVRAHYGDKAPTYAQYKALQGALYLQSIEAGFTGQMMRKHVAHAVKTAYGALPESDSPAAIAKRAQRPGKAAKTPKVGAAETFKAGMEHAQSNETIESFIARVGVTATLAALNRMLDTEEVTKAAAAACAAVIPMLNVA